MLNHIWLGLVVLAVMLGGVKGRLPAVTEAALKGAQTAVMEIALPLIGLTALWLGMMRLAEKSGLIESLARGLRPLLRWLFPEVPADHPAMGSMVMNIAANMIGLTNAATPLGLRAMMDLERLNPRPGTATNAMCTFLAINTSSVQLIPMTAISLLSVAGSRNPTAIVGTTLLATIFSTFVGITSVKLLAKLPAFLLPPAPASTVEGAAPTAVPDGAPSGPTRPPRPLPFWGVLVITFFLASMLGFWAKAASGPADPTMASTLMRWMNGLSIVAMPALLGFLPLYAALCGVKVYEEFVEGAKEGFQVAVRIIPFLLAILVAVGMFRAAGGIDLLTRALQPGLNVIGYPAELLPMTLTRPLSGSATIGLFSELVKTAGPDSLLARMGGTLLGSTETTFYVIAVYFGAVGIRRARHALAAGLLADLAGALAAVYVCRLVFGG